MKPTYNIPSLPPAFNYGSAPILATLGEANENLAKVKAKAAAFPFQAILIDIFSLQEAKASSEIGNIVVTQDELFKGDLFSGLPSFQSAKPVLTHRKTLKRGFDRMAYENGSITNKTLLEMYRMLTNRNDGFRMISGHTVRHEGSENIAYVPPQDAGEIQSRMKALEQFVNDDASGIDPLIRMAIIHHQFESIQPFADGNGRIGRMLNVLYLTRTGLLDIPILYLSHEINRSKSDYFRLLRAARDEANWEDWVIFMLGAVSSASIVTLELIESIAIQMDDYNSQIRQDLPKIYSQDLVSSQFRHPYTRIEFLQNDLGFSGKKAARYLDALAEYGFLTKHRAGEDEFYINEALIDLLQKASD